MGARRRVKMELGHGLGPGSRQGRAGQDGENGSRPGVTAMSWWLAKLPWRWNEPGLSARATRQQGGVGAATGGRWYGGGV